MADFHFEETCPCGATTKFSGYSSEARTQIEAWRGIHNRHMNAIAKAIENKPTHAPLSSQWVFPFSQPPWPQNPVTFNTETPSAGSKAES